MQSILLDHRPLSKQSSASALVAETKIICKSRGLTPVTSPLSNPLKLHPMKKICQSLAVFLLISMPALAQDDAVIEIELKPHATNPLGYDKTDLTVKAGQKVKLTLNNTGALAPQPHNFLLVKVGKLDAVGMQANAMLTDPKAMEKGYIPDAAKEDILFHTKLVQPGQTDTIEFTAPAEAGDYPYLCTFPGHWLLMRGVMHVTAE